MVETLAPYACDRCRARKVACCRTRSGCQRCKTEDVVCSYSRSGVIRRNKRRKHETLDNQPSSSSARSRNHDLPGDEGGDLQSQLATDIEVTRERLHELDNPQQNSLSALSSLSEAYAAVWQDNSEIAKTGSDFFLFKDHAESWADAFVATLNRGRPLFNSAPPEVLDHLRACRPHQVHDRAWLVMYYSIILSMVSSTNPMDASSKAKLRSNLWLALNDVRLLLEPSESNIQALTLLASHVEEFTTPSLCWMLVTTACRMLQALGINHRRFDSTTRERRAMMFWHLNILDQGLALAFGRPPTFHRAMAKDIALPTLEQLLPFQPHRTSSSAPALFGTHYLHQMILLSRIMADVWTCRYEGISPDPSVVESVSTALKSWYCQAEKILEAAALTEKPFLGPSSAASIDLGLRTLAFTYHYLAILLAQSSRGTKKQTIDSSRQMLGLLDDMVSDSEEPYNGIVWQLLCCPFTPFLALFGNIVSNSNRTSEENIEDLATMERFPIFLGKMSLRNSLAAKLERIALVIVQHARAVIHPQESRPNEAESDPSIRLAALPPSWPSAENVSHWEMFNHGTAGPGLCQPRTSDDNGQPSDLAPRTCDSFGFDDSIVDWLGWDNQFYELSTELFPGT